MTNYLTYKSILAAGFVGIILSCSNNEQFSISGNVKDGGGKTLYLENIAPSSVVLLDSTVLKSNGHFSFKRNRPDAPDFFQLRLGNQAINLSADSTENIIVEADTISFAKNYTVEGSEESKKIKTLALFQLTVNEEYNKLAREYRAKAISLDSFVAGIKVATDEYKAKAKEIIFENPASASAYFAVFQQINSMLIFNPYDRTDSKVLGAVANLWNLNYPKAVRTEHLKQLFTNSLKIMRGDNDLPQSKEMLASEYFDVVLPSINGEELHLSVVGKDRVILLDFTAYELEESPARNLLLAELYKKYYSRGFDIYQISLDSDRHFWKNAASNLPWNCVNDPQSIYSETAKRYNINQIPVCFILDKTGTATARIEDLRKAEAEIIKVLK
jgi:hypothetical protein